MAWLVVFIVLLINLPHSYAAVQKFSVEKARFSMDLPKSWQAVKSPLGLSFLIAGPYEKNKKRVLISVVPTETRNVTFSFDKISEEVDFYQKGRERWIKKYHGSVLEFIPYQKKSTPSVHEFHEFGFKYQLGRNSFIEKTAYLTCGKEHELYHIKSIIPNTANELQIKATEKIVSSFGCD